MQPIANQPLLPYPTSRFDLNTRSFPSLPEIHLTAPPPQQEPPQLAALREFLLRDGSPSEKEQQKRWCESIRSYGFLHGGTLLPSAFWPVHPRWLPPFLNNESEEIPLTIDSIDYPPVTTTPPPLPVSVEAADIPETLVEVIQEEGHTMSLTPGGDSIGDHVLDRELSVPESGFDLINYIDGSGSSMGSANDGGFSGSYMTPSMISPRGTPPSSISNCVIGNVPVSIPVSHPTPGTSGTQSPTAVPPPRRHGSRFTVLPLPNDERSERFHKRVMLEAHEVSPLPNGTDPEQTVRDYLFSKMGNQSGAAAGVKEKKQPQKKRGPKRKVAEELGARESVDESSEVLTDCALEYLCIAGEVAPGGGVVTLIKCQECQKEYHACCVRLSSNFNGQFVCCSS
ncbi:hypothetical protein CRE_22471 [Caenorhabditis remanei]|uniref:Uncharacterized protein n=1 Tax=Caenorhabditis remanei TaxID=31234 RepID=E3MED9_CAERE|nr:hypothetical protein CRE_22471 [Caenorhabditis remanei]